MRKDVLLGVMLLLALPLASAFDCDKVDDRENCEEIMGSDLSPEEKDLLIVNMLTATDLPAHRFVKEWNKGIVFNEVYPKDVKPKGAASVRNVWVKVAAVMPSVLEDDVLYSNGIGEVLVGHGFKIQVPSGRQFPDCRTEYEEKERSSTLDVYLNGKLLGHGKVLPFVSLRNNKFRAVLTVVHGMEIRHYRYKLDDGKLRCLYDHRHRWRATVSVEDELGVRYYEMLPEASIDAVRQYYGTTEGLLKAEDATALELKFQDSYYRRSDYTYGLDYSLEPYYVLTVTALPFKSESQRNIIVKETVDGLKFKLRNIEDCEYILHTHFDTVQEECSLGYKEEPRKGLDAKATYNLGNWKIAWNLAVLILMLYIVYKICKNKGKKNG